MNTKRICVAVAGAALLLPSVLMGQVDPGAGTGATPGMSQPNGQPGSANATNQPGSMRDSLGAPGQTGQQMLDKQFVRTAAEGSIADVKIGALATQKGSPAVKDLAQKLVDDHMMMDKDLGTVADSMGVMLPKKMGKDQQKEYEKLDGLSGKDFDTEYLTYMIKAHFEELHNYHMEASVAAEQELAAEVVKAMGMMHEHLGLIVNVAKEEGVPLPPRPQRPAPTTASK
jgi:putative membrane protein